MTTLQISPDRWTFGGVDLSSYAYLVMKIDGAEDLPGTRGNNYTAPGFPGERFAAKVDEGKHFALGLFVHSLNAAGAWDVGITSDEQQAQVNLDALRTLFGKRTATQALVHHLPDGSSRTAQAEALSLKVSDPAGRQAFLAVVDFYLPDPYFYGADVVDTARAVPTSPTDFTFTHPGSARGWKVALDILGPVASPRVTNLTNGCYLEVLVTVAGTTHLLVDAELMTATNDGVFAGGSVRHSGDALWLPIEPGANSLRVTGTGLSAATRITTTLKPPFHA